MLELLGDALIASMLADEEELPQSKQVRGGIRASREIEKLLGAEIKSVRPGAGDARAAGRKGRGRVYLGLSSGASPQGL